MVAMVFLVVHIVTTLVDSYVPTGWFSALVPLTSKYEPVHVALGAVAFDLILAVWVSSLLKARIANRSWRFIHWFSWLALASALAHSFLTGTDSRSSWGLALGIVCGAVTLLSALWRYFARPTRAAGRTALSPLAVAPLESDARDESDRRGQRR
jgi:DMSO/TMAO reductase YedYZ heme-binding membrane subunit